MLENLKYVLNNSIHCFKNKIVKNVSPKQKKIKIKKQKNTKIKILHLIIGVPENNT